MASIIDELKALESKHVIVYATSGETFAGNIATIDENCLVLAQAGTQRAIINIDNIVAVVHSD